MPPASIEKVPYWPATLLWAITPASPLSTSETLTVPPVTKVPSSVTEPLSPVICAASFVPVTVTVTVAVPETAPWASVAW